MIPLSPFYSRSWSPVWSLTFQSVSPRIAGMAIVLLLFAGCGRSGSPSNRNGKPKATIAADPNPVPAGSDAQGTTIISWDTGDGSMGEVYVLVNRGEEK